MTKSSRFARWTIAAAALVAAMGFAAPSVAKADSILATCVGATRQIAVECCRRISADERPVWMKDENADCGRMVVCGGKAGANRCRVQLQPAGRNGTSQQRQQQAVSDMRLKTDIHLIGTTRFGLPLYRFHYRGQPGIYVGVMAQDVLKVKPEAVTLGANGYYMVDYAMLGLTMTRLDP